MKTNILLIALIVSLSGCFTERIDIDLNEEDPKFVVDAWITDLDEPQFVTLSRTVNYLGDQAIDYITGAAVTISDNTTTYALEEREENGIIRYYLPDDWEAQIGDLYTLNILYEGEEYTASHLMRSAPEIENPRARLFDPESSFFDEEQFDTDVYEILFAFQERPGEGDGYYLIDYGKGLLSGDSLVNGEYADDELIDGEYLTAVSVTAENEFHELGDEVVLEVYSIGSETVDFLNEVDNAVFEDGPFAAPPANVRTNVSNGAIGYFIASGVQKIEFTISEETIEEETETQ